MSHAAGKILATLRPGASDSYISDFRVADESIANGRVSSTSLERENFCLKWCEYVRPLGIDPYLHDTEFNTIIRAVTGFGGRVRGGNFGRGHQVSCGRVAVAIWAIGQTCELDRGCNPLHRAPENTSSPPN